MLSHLHDRSVLHGDLRPENVFTRSDGSVEIDEFTCGLVLYHLQYQRHVTRGGCSETAQQTRGKATKNLHHQHPFHNPTVWEKSPLIILFLPLSLGNRQRRRGKCQCSAEQCLIYPYRWHTGSQNSLLVSKLLLALESTYGRERNSGRKVILSTTKKKE